MHHHAPTTAPDASRMDALDRLLSGFKRLAVAFSGGVDSSVLLHAATRVLGPERTTAVIADSPSLPRSELLAARATAEAIGAPLVVVSTSELNDERYAENRGDRCYWCKHALFERMTAWAADAGHPALAFGEIADDALDVRPGGRAARERGVHAPLAEAGWTKLDVRAYARRAGLAVAEKPASACLASRVPTGTRVTAERLARVERAEEAVRALGFRVLRVRDRGVRCRLEVGEAELARARAAREELERVLGEAGFELAELAVYGRPGSPSASASRPT